MFSRAPRLPGPRYANLTNVEPTGHDRLGASSPISTISREKEHVDLCWVLCRQLSHISNHAWTGHDIQLNDK